MGGEAWESEVSVLTREYGYMDRVGARPYIYCVAQSRDWMTSAPQVLAIHPKCYWRWVAEIRRVACNVAYDMTTTERLAR
jgi:hypothetical protein